MLEIEIPQGYLMSLLVKKGVLSQSDKARVLTRMDTTERMTLYDQARLNMMKIFSVSYAKDTDKLDFEDTIRRSQGRTIIYNTLQLKNGDLTLALINHITHML